MWKGLPNRINIVLPKLIIVMRATRYAFTMQAGRALELQNACSVRIPTLTRCPSNPLRQPVSSVPTRSHHRLDLSLGIDCRHMLLLNPAGKVRGKSCRAFWPGQLIIMFHNLNPQVQWDARFSLSVYGGVGRLPVQLPPVRRTPSRRPGLDKLQRV